MEGDGSLEVFSTAHHFFLSWKICLVVENLMLKTEICQAWNIFNNNWGNYVAGHIGENNQFKLT